MLAVSGEEGVERLARVAGAQVHRLGAVVEDPAVGCEVAQAHHGTQRLVRHGLVDLVADGQLGVVDLDGAGADEHRVAEPAQSVGVEAGGAAGDPAAGAVGGGAAPVEGGGELPGDERAAVLEGEGPRAVDGLGVVGEQPGLHLDAGLAQRGRHRPTATGLVSAWANTTRRTPAAISASEQGPVRPVWLHGSRVTTAVVPRAASPASRSASTSACGPPAPRWKPSATVVPSGARSTHPTRGLGPSGTPGVTASASARRMAAALCLAGRHLRLRSGWDSGGRATGHSPAEREGWRASRQRALLIRTMTVGPGFPPGQPATGCGRVADCDRRCGVPPPPEHASSSWSQPCHSARHSLTGVRR